MQQLVDSFVESWINYGRWFTDEVLFNYTNKPWWQNYFYWLVGLSAFFMIIEWVKPWREKQPRFRRDFWIDMFYMFFNFFLFSLLIYNAASDVVVQLFNDGIKAVFSFDLQASNPMRTWPVWAILLTGFLVRDFVQWLVHRLLHKVEFLWRFHKVHHSVEEMGFAAHLRYHWMENVVYRSIEYIPLALLGIGLHDFFIIHIFTLAVGHYNHSNLQVNSKIQGGVFGTVLGAFVAFVAFENAGLSLGLELLIIGAGTLFGTLVLGRFMKYIFNGPGMHIWHHAYELPAERKFGVNFGLSLSCWDYLFGTAYIPHDGRDIKLGFPGIDKYPKRFLGQFFSGFNRKHDVSDAQEA